jgi:Flp pilus assembly protein TadG
MRRPKLESARRLGSRKGNAMVESALSFLAVMFIFIAIMEFGLGIYTYNFVSYAAREGSRYAAARGAQSSAPTDATAVQTWVRNQAVALDSDLVSVNTTWNPNNTPGNTVTVNVSYPLTPLIGVFLGNITVWSESTMPIAQ